MKKSWQISNSELTLIFPLIFLGAALRIVPHPDNFTPLTGMALFAGSQIANPLLAISTALFALFLSDLFLGLYSLMPIVYGSFAIMIFLGKRLGPNPNFAKISVSALFGGFVFFILTNFAVWALGSMYTHNLSGLSTCFLAALPFYRNAIAGDILFSLGLFGLAKVLKKSFFNTRSINSLS